MESSLAEVHRGRAGGTSRKVLKSLENTMTKSLPTEEMHDTAKKNLVSPRLNGEKRDRHLRGNQERRNSHVSLRSIIIKLFKFA